MYKYILFVFFVSCGFNKKEDRVIEVKPEFSEEVYVLHPQYEVGDSRRYGVFPDSINTTKHPKTNLSKIQTLLDISSKTQTEIVFTKGYYGTNLILDSRENINLKFEKAEFNLVRITDEKGTKSSNINFRGSLIAYDQFGTYGVNNIKIDSLILKSDINKNLNKLRGRGCHLYRETNNLHINYLYIEDLGSGINDMYRNSHAALALDGLRLNPQNVSIDEIYIKSSDRHGAYITGSNHEFKKITIEQYGQGDLKGMSGMQDAISGEEKIFSGLWINRCYDCVFESVILKSKKSKKGFILKLDEGISEKPTIIENLTIDVPLTDELILDNIHTNVLVKKVLVKNDKEN